MLKLTKTESLIVEFLKDGAKNTYEIEQHIDHAKDFSKDYVKSMVHKLNEKAGRRIVDWKNEAGGKVWFLPETSFEYEVENNLKNAIEDLHHLKVLACNNCTYRINAQRKWKTNMILGTVMLILVILCTTIGYLIGSSTGKTELNIDQDALKTIKCAQ